MREEVEELKARRVGEVGVVRVWREVVVRVRRVDRVRLAGEVPKATVVRGADVRDPFDQLLRCRR